MHGATHAVHAYRLTSLDAPHIKSINTDLASVMGTDEPQFSAVDDWLWLRPAITGLPERERRILAMRFYLQMSQAQIGAEIGVSQVQISRLLVKTLNRLHTVMTVSSRST